MSDAGTEWVPGGGETNPTDGSQSPAEGGESQDTQTGGDGFGQSSGGLRDRLLSTTPTVDVGQAGREFSTSAGWEGHLSAFLTKFTGNEGVTAFEHALWFVVLFLLENREKLPDGTETGETDDGDSDETVPGTEDGKMVL